MRFGGVLAGLADPKTTLTCMSSMSLSERCSRAFKAKKQASNRLYRLVGWIADFSVYSLRDRSNA